MMGKIGLVVGLGAGYVLGSRAGRGRYEQIKKQWLKIWHLDPVQAQVDKVKGYAKSTAVAIPAAVWKGAVKTVRAVGDSANTAADKVIDATDKAEAAVKDAAKSAKSEN